MGTLWQPHPTQDQPAPPGGREFGIDSRIGAASTRAPAASMEDSRPQAILKFHRLSSLDYRVRHELPVTTVSFWLKNQVNFKCQKKLSVQVAGTRCQILTGAMAHTGPES